MASIRQRGNQWQARVRVPLPLVPRYGTTHLARTIRNATRQAAKAEAHVWEAGLRAEWAELLGHVAPSQSTLRSAYNAAKEEAEAGGLRVEVRGEDPELAGIDHQLEAIAEEVGQRELSPLEAARVAGLQDAARHLQGARAAPRREYEPTFAAIAEGHMTMWGTQRGLKDSNTAQQKRATFALFAGYWGERPIREVRRADAARFLDTLRQLEPTWARSPRARELGWADLTREFGGRASGLSDATMNRHTATLGALWDWAADRGHCEGRNPFKGFSTTLREGRNVQGYQPWSLPELKQMMAAPPTRRDVLEVMIVGMYTGMRLDEIASLTGGQVAEEDGTAFIRVDDAKTPAGVRQVPLHPALGWLRERSESAGGGRLWPGFNPEGPGKKPGADAGREFSRYKSGLGFTARTKTFHSFRKNFVGQLEAAGVHESEVAQLVGHEKGFTFRRYGQGITLARKAEIVRLVDYRLRLPEGLDGRGPNRSDPHRPRRGAHD